MKNLRLNSEEINMLEYIKTCIDSCKNYMHFKCALNMAENYIKRISNDDIDKYNILQQHISDVVNRKKTQVAIYQYNEN